MKCINCGNEVNIEDTFCDKCGNEIDKSDVVYCDKCGKPNGRDDAFCGYCGKDLSEVIKYVENLEIEKRKEELAKKEEAEKDKKMKERASNLIIDCEGNKFKAIKEFKEEFDVDNDVATKYITAAYNQINGINDEHQSESKEIIEDSNSVDAIVERNHYDKVASINEVKKTHGLGLYEAKQLVDDAVAKKAVKPIQFNSKAIVKTIIVSQSSRKKATSTVARGLVGHAIMGPIGLLAGASGKTKEETTFQVIYANGRQETVTVPNNSYKFKEYCKYLVN